MHSPEHNSDKKEGTPDTCENLKASLGYCAGRERQSPKALCCVVASAEHSEGITEMDSRFVEPRGEGQWRGGGWGGPSGVAGGSSLW